MFGQSSGIQGVVRDSTGAVIPGAIVRVTNLETNVPQNVVTNQVGLYRVPLLNAGRYSVECTARGFAPQARPQMRLEVGQTARVDFELKVGTIAEVVEVSAAAALLDSETTTVGQVIDNKRVLEMPLNGRNYLELALFTVGVLPARQLGKGSRMAGEREGEGAFRAVGMHVAQNTVLLDGNDNSSRTSGGPLGFQSQAVKPPVDAVGEFKVVTNNTSAEYGYRAGGKVLVSTRSGTNEFHGSLYEFLRNDKLDGTNFFANRAGFLKPTYRQNQFGGTFGGPVIRNKTFFFASYQGTRIRIGRSFTSTVPSLDALNGDFSQQPPQRRNIFDPLTISGRGANAVRLQFPGNRIPASRFDPVAKKVADLYPAPNITGRDHLPDNFFFSPSESIDFDQYDFRADHNFNDLNRLFIRYSIRNQTENQPGSLPFPAMGGTGQTIRLDGDNVVLNYNRTIGTTMHNEFRVGWSHFPTRFDIPFDENWNKRLGIQGAPGDSFDDGLDHGLSLFLPSGFAQVGPRGFWPNQNNLDNLYLADNFLIQRGRHSIKLGGEFRRANIFREAQRHRRGRFNFSGVYTAERPNAGSSRANTGNGLADMLLGWANNGRYGNAQGENIVAPYWGFFLQDDWKISSKLTLNVGLRWELFVTPYFPNPDGQSVVRYLTEINGRPFGSEEFVFPQDGRDCGCKEDFNNFAPRLGLAYRLNNRTVVRAGAGIYYGESDYLTNEITRFVTGPPRHNEIDLAQPRETSSFLVQDGFPAFFTGVIPRNVNVTTTHDFLPTLYAGQWFFDVQREMPFDTLLTVGYNGSATTHMHTSLNINGPLTPHPTVRWQDRKIRTQFNAVNVREAMLNASYQSMTVKAEKRFAQGFTFLSSFTWSHSIDYGNEALEQGGSGRAWARDVSRERANSNLDRRLGYVLSFLYELPFGRGRRWLQSGPGSWMLGGWQFGGLLSLLSGTPDDHSINVDNQNLGGRVRGDFVRNPNLPSSERSIDRWFDTGFVAPSAPGVISNAGRNLIYGPGRRNFDVVVSKNFQLPWESQQLQFRFESFNFTNTPHFGRPNTSIGSPAAGRINDAEEPRRIQLALKYVF